MVDTTLESLSQRQQCTLLGIGRSSIYYKPVVPSDETILSNQIHDIWLEFPEYGYRRVTAALQRLGYDINHKKVLRIMRAMGLQAIYPKPRTTEHHSSHKTYPYLLKGLSIQRSNQVWATDITYIRLPGGFVYLVAIIDVYSRFIVAWRISNTLDVQFCIDMLSLALLCGKPDILNTDQGCQFTSALWVCLVESHGIKVSMDGRGRWADNVFIERFWRTLKHAHVLIHAFETVSVAKQSIGGFIEKYNHKRLHQSLGYKTPAEVYLQGNDFMMASPAGHLHPTLTPGLPLEPLASELFSDHGSDRAFSS
jgi:putative transposase